MDRERRKVAATVTFYMVAALTMVMGNKWVLNGSPLPLSLLIVQMWTSVIFLWAISIARLPLGSHGKPFSIPRVFSVSEGSDGEGSGRRPFMQLWPLIAVTLFGLVMNTYCLQYVSASTYQIVRGLILPFTIILSYVFLGQTVSRFVLVACGLITLGFIFGVSPNMVGRGASISFLGTLLGLLSSIGTAAHATVIKHSFKTNDGTLELAYFVNLLCSLILLPIAVASGEVLRLWSMLQSRDAEFWTFVSGGLLTGVFGFLICVAGLLSVKVTSPISHMVSSAVRGVLQAALGYGLFGDQLGIQQIVSITIILGGSMYYTWIKDQEMQQKQAPQYLPLTQSKTARDDEIEVLVDSDVEVAKHSTSS